MTTEAESVGRDILDGAKKAKGVEREVTVSGLRHWGRTEFTELLDYILDNQSSDNLRLKGVRTDTGMLGRFSLPLDTSNSSQYRDVPVVVSERVDFDVIQFVFQPC